VLYLRTSDSEQVDVMSGTSEGEVSARGSSKKGWRAVMRNGRVIWMDDSKEGYDQLYLILPSNIDIQVTKSSASAKRPHT
jgi:hypothetical protein